MYHTGEFIVYGSSGVCRVLAVGSPEAAQGSRPCTYYTLQPVYSSETIYAPVDSRVAMRPVLTKAEAQQLIRCFPSIPEEHIVEVKNVQTLSRYYQDSFHANSCRDLVRLLKTIHSRNSAARKNGRRPGKVEGRYQKRAEELLYGELSISLGIPLEEVPQYIRQVLKDEPPSVP